MRIQRNPQPPRPPQSPEVRKLKNQIILGDTLVGAVQGAIEGSAGVMAIQGFYKAALPLTISQGLSAKRSNRDTLGQNAAFSAARTCLYAAAGAITGSEKVGLLTTGVGALVGAGLAYRESLADLHQRGF